MGFSVLWESTVPIDLTGGGAWSVIGVMESGCEYRWNLALWPTAHLLPCSPVHHPVQVRGLGLGTHVLKHSIPREGWPRAMLTFSLALSTLLSGLEWPPLGGMTGFLILFITWGYKKKKKTCKIHLEEIGLTLAMWSLFLSSSISGNILS